MKTELFIYESGAWKQADLYGDADVPVTLCVSDVADFTKVSASRSETVRLPMTPANDKLFRRAWCVSETGSFEMGVRVPARLIVDGEEMSLNWAELLSVTTVGGRRDGSFELILYSDTAALYGAMKDYYLKENEDAAYDVDLSDLDHEMTLATVHASFFASPGTGYTYVCADKQNRHGMAGAQAESFRLDEMTPCVFVKEVWDRLFEMHGFSYESTFLNSDRFKRLLYPHTDRWMYRDDADLASARSLVGGSTVVSLTVNKYDADHDEWAIATYKGDAAHTDQGSGEAFDNATGYYTAAESGWYSLKTAVPWRVSFSSVSGTIRASGSKIRVVANVIKKAGTSLSTAAQITSAEIPVGNDTFDNNLIKDLHTLETSRDGIFLNAGEQMYVTLYLWVKTRDDNGVWLWKDASTGTNVDVTFTFGGYEPVAGSLIRYLYEFEPRVSENSTVPMSSILHKIKQSDFVNSIVKAFNLYVEPVGANRFRIEPRDAYYALGTTAVDWTDRLDRSQETVVEGAADLRRRPVVMRYDEDSDFFNECYADSTGKKYGEYVGNSGSSGEEYEVKLSFAATPGGRLCDERTMQVPKIFKLDADGHVEEDARFKPRLLYWNGWSYPSEPSDRFVMRSLNGHSMTYSGWPAAGHFDAYYGNDAFDLNFGSCQWYWYDLPVGDWSTWNNLFNYYWLKYVTELSDPDTKKLTARFRLTPRDVSTIRMYSPILVDGVYYRINRINSFKKGELTEVELINMNDVYVTYPVKHPRPVKPKPIAIAPSISKKPPFSHVIDANSLANSLRTVDKYVALPERTDDVIDSMGGRPIGETPFEYRSSDDAYDVIDGNIADAPQLTSLPTRSYDWMPRISERSD